MFSPPTAPTAVTYIRQIPPLEQGVAQQFPERNMSLTDQALATSTLPNSTTGGGIASLNQLKLRLSQLETQLSRLAIVYGLDYGCLQKLAPCFLRVKAILLKMARLHANDSDLIDLAEAVLTDASEHDLCELEEQLLCMRAFAQDPAKGQFAPSYRALMNDLFSMEQELQSALQKALGNIAG